MNGDGVEILKVKTFPHLTINELLEPCPGSDFEAARAVPGQKMGGRVGKVLEVRKNSCQSGCIVFSLVFGSIFFVGIKKSHKKTKRRWF